MALVLGATLEAIFADRDVEARADPGSADAVSDADPEPAGAQGRTDGELMKSTKARSGAGMRRRPG